MKTEVVSFLKHFDVIDFSGEYMIPKENLKLWQVHTPEGWVDAEFGQLEEGDIIRELNRDGSVVILSDGRSEYVVERQPNLSIASYWLITANKAVGA